MIKTLNFVAPFLLTKKKGPFSTQVLLYLHVNNQKHDDDDDDDDNDGDADI